MEYTPDNWVIIEIKSEAKPFYKVLAGWSGGYGGGGSWRMNSGINHSQKMMSTTTSKDFQALFISAINKWKPLK